MKIEYDRKLGFENVMLAPNRSTLQSRKDITLERKFEFYHSPKKWAGLPLIAANMSSIAGEDMGRALQAHKCITPLHKYFSTEDLVRIFSDPSINTDYVWVTIGFSEKDLEKVRNVVSETGRNVNISVEAANGHIDKFCGFCYDVRQQFPSAIIMAGNSACTEVSQELVIRGGVDIVKCGISQGSVCRTLNQTAIGFPQLSCLMENSHVLHGLRNGNRRLGLICSDGGCKEIGDICRAYAGGSDFVMIGGLLAGTDECCGEWEYEYLDPYGNYSSEDSFTDKEKEETKKRKRCMKYYGMSSKYAQEKHDEFKSYRASEGTEKWVDYKGPVEDTLNSIKGGLRSCCTYSGAHSLKDLNKTAKFIVVK